MEWCFWPEKGTLKVDKILNPIRFHAKLNIPFLFFWTVKKYFCFLMNTFLIFSKLLLLEKGTTPHSPTHLCLIYYEYTVYSVRLCLLSQQQLVL